MISIKISIQWKRPQDSIQPENDERQKVKKRKDKNERNNFDGSNDEMIMIIDV